MADVRPFRGVTFDPDRVDVARVLCPPYDVISPRQQEAYYARDPHNAVRIVLNRGEGRSRYLEAARELDEWLAGGTLVRDAQPAFYVHRQTFTGPIGEAISRTGVLAAVRLEPWESGAVKPHEHTMPGPKADRLELMRATHADTEAIWVFHPDPARELVGALEAITASPPAIKAVYSAVSALDGDEPPETHELWRVQSVASVDRLARLASDAQLYIADGHHRYETALHHAREVGGGPDDAVLFKLMLLTAAEDPGLLVLPTHRLVRLAEGQSVPAFTAALTGLGWSAEPLADLSSLTARLGTPAAMGRLGFGVVAGGAFTWLEGAVIPGDTSRLPPSIAALDLGLLHEGVLRPLLGLDPETLAEGRRVEYSREAVEVERRVSTGEFDLGILVRAPSLEQVRAVADARQNMPQKSTYFWPKPASGLVMMLQAPDEPL